MRIQDLNEICVEHVNNVRTAYTKQGDFKEIVRNDWAIMLKYEGTTYYHTPDGKKYLSDSKHVLLTRAGSHYIWNCEKEGTVAIIEFDAAFERFIPENENDILSLYVNDNRKFIEIHKEMEMVGFINSDSLRIKLIKSVYEILLLLMESNVPPPYIRSEKFEKIRPALEYINRNFEKNITNDILSRQCKISTAYLRKLFTEMFDISPRAYVFRLRMDEAKTLLLKKKYKTIAEVAACVGYKDVYQFTKMFKKYTGLSPKKYAMMGNCGSVDCRTNITDS